MEDTFGKKYRIKKNPGTKVFNIMFRMLKLNLDFCFCFHLQMNTMYSCLNPHRNSKRVFLENIFRNVIKLKTEVICRSWVLEKFGLILYQKSNDWKSKEHFPLEINSKR